MSDGFGIYIHVPWCRSRCPYCAFNVLVDNAPPHGQWQAGILEAWQDVSTAFEGSAHSLYFGGGTPSLLPPDIVAELIASFPLQSDVEITLEANPGSVTKAQLSEFRDAGVGRLSLGIQTFDLDLARTLGRGHTVAQAEHLIHDVHDIGFDTWSFDLIFGLPQQTMASLQNDLDRVLAIAPPHVSLYGLTIEPGTPFHAAHEAGTLVLPDTDTWRAQYDLIVDSLTAHGWDRYEVSNFARPGHRGIHNESVWRGGHYAGLGPGAHGFHPNGDRTLCEPDLSNWLDDPAPARIRPATRETAIDYLLSTLRHCDGTDLQTLARRSEFNLRAEAIESMVSAGFLEHKDPFIRLTPMAYPVADGVIRHLVDALMPAYTP